MKIQICKISNLHLKGAYILCDSSGGLPDYVNKAAKSNRTLDSILTRSPLTIIKDLMLHSHEDNHIQTPKSMS